MQPQGGPGGPAPGWEYAGFWIRVAAYIIDSVILGIVWTIAFVIIGVLALFPAMSAATTIGADGTITNSEGVAIAVGVAGAVTLLVLLGIVLTVLYFIVLWVKRGGTFGQTLLGMRVAREADGAPIGWVAATIRYVMFVVGWAVFYLGVIWVAFEPRKRGWHDIVAGTVVVRRV